MHRSIPEDLPTLPARQADTHKGDYGRALLVGGSLGMSGAISLCGTAALRSGAGLATVATAAPCLPMVAGYEPSYMTAGLPSDEQGRISNAARSLLKDLTLPATSVACGPGLGRSESLQRLTSWLYTTLSQPSVFDADALFALAADPDLLSRGAGPRVLTPHPGEFMRLVPAARQPAADLRQLAVRAAADWGVVVVLKGHRTLVTDGQRQFVNPSGNPGMATGGTGDVLSGVITGLLCQGLDPFAAAQLGVYLHGLAGDLAASELGQTSLIASDLLRFLPQAFQTVTRC
ncbi:MAG: NAD(P)H-hydrate dehydratase [Planctomycetales bacterium]|nr:NAD(P)H-hydrate dehydratase [Planctomycetales bacterium]NIP69563.1 NAD(P)H-hydrate dehydratase [Planctomycetales bacterium]